VADMDKGVIEKIISFREQRNWKQFGYINSDVGTEKNEKSHEYIHNEF